MIQNATPYILQAAYMSQRSVCFTLHPGVLELQGIFETSVLNKIKTALDSMTSKVPHTCFTSPSEPQIHSIWIYD